MLLTITGDLCNDIVQSTVIEVNNAAMGSIEGVIILSPTNEVIITSQFSHPLDNYASLHIDQLVARLHRAQSIVGGERTNEDAGAQRSALSSSSRGKGSGWDLSRWSEGVLPLTLTEGIPSISPADDDDDDDKGEESSASVQRPRNNAAPSASSAALAHLEHNGLRFAAAFSRKINPLIPITFLQVVIGNLESYLGAPVSEDAIRDNFDVVYQLLEEMLDESGQPLHTECNSLRELVREPNWIDDIVSRVGAVSGLSNAALGNAMSAPRLSNIPWRRPVAPASRSIRNEAYFDVVETIQGIFARGKDPVPLGPVSIQCRVEGTCKLSGTPDLILRLSGAEKHILDASLHPCVRLRTWRKDRILNFVPPDGHFILADFRMQSATSIEKHIPVRLVVSKKEKRSSDDESSTFRILLSCTRTVEDIEVFFSIGNRDSTVETTLSGGTRPGLASEDLNAARGSFQYSPKTGMARWHIPQMTSEQRPLEINGTIKGDHAARLSTAVTCRFSVANLSLTGLKVASVEITTDAQSKPYKGVRSVLRGDLDWRW